MDLQNMDLQGGSFRFRPKSLQRSHGALRWKWKAWQKFPAGPRTKKLKDLLEASIQPPVAVEMRDGTAELTLHLIMASGARIPAVAEKVQENVEVGRAEHDQCHGEPCESGDRGSCCGAVRALAAVQKNG